MAEVKLLQLGEVVEGLGRDALHGAVRDVEGDELRNHLERVCLNLLQGVVVQVEVAQVRNV